MKHLHLMLSYTLSKSSYAAIEVASAHADQQATSRKGALVMQKEASRSASNCIHQTRRLIRSHGSHLLHIDRSSLGVDNVPPQRAKAAPNMLASMQISRDDNASWRVKRTNKIGLICGRLFPDLNSSLLHIPFFLLDNIVL